MNNIGKLVKQYNRFIEDVSSLNSSIRELITNELKLEFAKEYWSPRDRSAWSSKERYSGWYTSENIVLYVCINLITDIPYLQFLKCDVNLENSNPGEFGIEDGFYYVENDEIEKTTLSESDYFISFEQDWGKCHYCKIDLSTIDSDEVVNRDIKKILECFINNNYKESNFNNLKFL